MWRCLAGVPITQYTALITALGSPAQGINGAGWTLWLTNLTEVTLDGSCNLR
jgi:hypothetical protein